MKKKKNLDFLLNCKYCRTLLFSFIHLLSCLLIFSIYAQDITYARSSKSAARSKHHIRIKKYKRTPEEEAAAKEAAAALAHEASLVEGRNLVFAKAYRLLDSGTNESLQGNHKYAVLQLKLADELLQEHGQTNTSLAIATLMSLTSSAQCAKEYPLAKSTCERLITMRPQDTQLLLRLATIEIAQGNFRPAQNELNKILELEPSNAEAKLLTDLLQDTHKPSKTVN